MLDVFLTMLPIYLMILIGFASVRTGYMEGAHVQGLGQFVLKIALIGMIFSALAVPGEGAALNPAFFAAYLGASVVALVLSYVAVRLILRREAMEAWVLSMGMTNSNGVFLGLPITHLFFGDIAAVVFAMAFIVENLVTLPAPMVAAGMAGHVGSARGVIRDTALRLAKNPFLVALVLALLVRVSGLPMPEPVARTFGMMASSAVPVALFVIGGMVAGMSLAGYWRRSLIVAAGKLGLHPVLVAVALLIVPGVPPDLIPVGIVYAAMPMVTIYPILAAPFGLTRVTSSAVVVTTLLSCLTVSTVLLLV